MMIVLHSLFRDSLLVGKSMNAMRFISVTLLVVHALLHSIGFFRAFGFMPAGKAGGNATVALSPAIEKSSGIIWLTVCLLFLSATALYMLERNWWWMLAIVALVLSQILIIIYWKEAGYGTIANIIILFAAMAGYGSWSFNRMAAKEIQSLAAEVSDANVVNLDESESLPPIVQKWLRNSGVNGRGINTVHLKQSGEMLTSPDGNWMPVTSEQYFTVNPPGFVWLARVNESGIVSFSGRDRYEDGKGHMLIKVLNLFPIVNADGAAIDQGTMVRYLAETVWFPSAAVSDYIKWKELDSLKAEATMTYTGITASGVFTFNAAGDVESFEAQRYYDRDGIAILETWYVAMSPDSYQEFDGVRIPTRSSVTWKLESGDFTWYKLEIQEVVYDP